MKIGRQTFRRAARLGAVGALLLIGGCCGGDSGGSVLPAPQRQAVGQVGLEVPSVPVEKTTPGPLKVDVMFLLDDSDFVTSRTPEPGTQVILGQILTPGDGRIKTDVAQGIFQDAVERLETRLVADGLGTAEDFDLAFGVSRYEDFANFERSGPRASDPTLVSGPIDGLARPFILNQPILQSEHPQFNVLFAAALQRTTPGDGGRDPFDAQSALEALYQLATGTGFDGNSNGNTTESGPAGALDTQVDPGTSGDVPAFEATPQGPLPDGSPVFQVGETLASGNLGGAGWRPGSIRFVIVFSDLCTISPLLPGTDLDGAIDNTPSAPGEGPRPSETVKSVQAFACSAGEEVLPPSFPGPTDKTSQQAYARFGPTDGAIPVAPPGAATLQATIDALNEMNIEVLGIGIREGVGSGPNKPNVPPPAFPGQEPAVVDPSEPPDNKAPFTWMSAMAILTGARDTETVDTIVGPVTDLPLVYNLTTVNPPDAPVTDDVVEDLADRIAVWMPFADTGGEPTDDPGSVYYLYVFDLTNPNPELVLDPDPGFALIPDVDPGGTNPIYLGPARDGGGDPIPGTQIVRIPCYFVGDSAPAPVRVAWQFSAVRTNRENTDVVQAAMPFVLTGALADDSSQFPPGTWPGSNPTGPHAPSSLNPPATGGSIQVVIPAVPPLPQAPQPGTVALTDLLRGEALFRDVTRGLPAGTSIFTMAGPLTDADLPFP
ncbi:MAG: hypothetical protein ACC662_03520 [Planctomycetota bacterium]